MKYLTNLDMVQNELQNAVIQPLATAPASGVLGQIYFNSTDKFLYQHDGSMWKQIGGIYEFELVGAMLNTVSLKLLNPDGQSMDNVQFKGAGGTTLSVENDDTLVITTANTNTTYTFTGTAAADKYTVTITPSSGTAQTVVIPLATASAAGLLSPAEKTLIGTIPSKAPLNSPAFTGSPTTPNPTGTTGIANKGYVDSAVADGIAASDAMIFKGTLGTGGTITALPTTYKTGWTYRVIAAGTYAGNKCEIGDLIIALVDRAGSGNVNADWTVAQTNTDGEITNITGTSPIVVTGSGANREISHADSGVTPTVYWPVVPENPQFGDSLNLQFLAVDAKGHVVETLVKSVKIPETGATDSIDGLLSASDFCKLRKLQEIKRQTKTIAAGQTSVVFMVMLEDEIIAVNTTVGQEPVIADVNIDFDDGVTVSISKPYSEPVYCELIYTTHSYN